MGDLKPGKVLFIASGNAGKTWAKGAQLGEQSGAVMVNNIQVRFLPFGHWLSFPQTHGTSEIGWINLQSEVDSGYSDHLRGHYKATHLGNADLC